MLISREESWACLTDDKLKEISKVLFNKIDHNRTMSIDYTETIKILREVYNAGRSRGVYENSGQ